ncbi:hypothetical protein KIH41_07795 [Litoribacter ruber]|uniref:hypothetical protein n=1 Tax=Litoribacter ruber TaxID=702568 RepID=UPI001BD99990|nr:hypothetical protein [Litoribacter ruber]MBT0811179.1 hypothetical protein [Litoribacter ruber]
MIWARHFFKGCALLLLVVFSATAQDNSCRWLGKDDLLIGVRLDSLTVVPESIAFQHADSAQFAHSYNLTTGILKVESLRGLDSLQVCYQTLPFDLGKKFAHRTLAEHYDSAALFKDNRIKASEVFDFREEIFPTSNLQKSGNLTRGISFGNTQNVFVNSALNLQMDGQLADNLYVRASITDQNVPFQPEGNTQQLQDFDNVLIELYNDKMSLSAGDVMLQNRPSDFLRYYKNVQGLQFTTGYDVGENWKASTQVAASIAKGKFASSEIPILEGVLGPYRIRGPQNERFVIIMANSEKVFLDGRQLKRGFNYDYVIDYNQGEITFTTNVLITQYSRIRIDFEYAERNFQRSILSANHTQENKHVMFYLNYYKEEDNRNRPLFFEFSDQDKQLLSSVGNNIDQAVIPRVDSTAFDPNRVMYERRMRENGEVIYVYSTAAEEARFIPSFLQVGRGNGDYVRRQQLANGVVYEFVEPINGVRQGDYSIQAPLPAPSKKEMVTAGTVVKLGLYEQFYSEVALSTNDQNLFSEIDNNENKGYAFKSGLRSQNRRLGLLPDYSFKGQAEVEYNSVNFSFIDRVRYIEFDRDWSLQQEDLMFAASEKLFSAQAEVVKDADNLLSYRVNLRNRGEVLNGYQHLAQFNQQIGNRVFLRNEFFNLNSQIRQFQSDWIRYRGDVSYRSKIFVPGYSYHVDKNAVSAIESDSVVSTAMNFEEHKFFIRSNDTLPYSFFADASWREDYFPIQGEMLPETKAFTTQYGLQRKFGVHDLKGTFTYRQMEYVSRDLPMETTIMGRLDYLGSAFAHNLRNELSYAIGNGRELRREFVFVPVPPGEGTHTWRDDNGDGIQQLNEFYIAINPEEKNFVKIFVPTDEYIQAYNTIFNYRLNAKFPDAWRKTAGAKKFLSRFSNNTSWNVDKKVTANDFRSRVIPLANGIADEDLVSIRQSIRSSVFFNRAVTKYGFDLSLFNSQFKQLLSGGFEDMIQQDLRLNSRYQLSSLVNLRMMANRGQRAAASDFLDNRNYTIAQHGYGPELAFQPSSVFRTTANYTFTGKRNLENIEFEEVASLHQMGLDVRFARAIKTTLNANFNYTFINYNGEANSPVGYEMLQALTPGNNFIWNLNWLQKIGEGLQLNMVYEGRNSEGLGRIIHVGRMQVSALF